MSATGDHDIYYNKDSAGTPPSAIFEDSDQFCSTYSKEGFCKQYKTFIEKVNTSSTFRTWLKENFRNMCRLNEPPTEEERGSQFGVDQPQDTYDSDDNKDYQDSARGDVTLVRFDKESMVVNHNSQEERPKNIRQTDLFPSSQLYVATYVAASKIHHG
jgi:hypothetical protein